MENNIWIALEKGNESELRLRSYEEITDILEEYKKYVPVEKQEEFFGIAKALEEDCVSKVKQINEWEIEYNKKIESGEYVPFNEKPDLKKAMLKTELKKALIKLIFEYFDKHLFKANKSSLKIIEEKTTNEQPYDLYVTLHILRNRLYTFLSIIGHHQLENNYFISYEDRKNINYFYTGEVNKVNRNLGMKFKTFDIFYKPKRLDAKKYIDIDKVSLLNLVYPYLRVNHKELIEIIKIIDKYFNSKYKPIEFKEYHDALAELRRIEMLSDEFYQGEKQEARIAFKKLVGKLKWDKIQMETNAYLEKRRNEGAKMWYKV